MLDHPVNIVRTTRLGGGCTHKTFRIDTSRESYFLKTHDGDPTTFVAEARQLVTLSTSPTTLSVPTPLAAIDTDMKGPGLLLLPYIHSATPVASWEEVLGQGLAHLHHASAAHFGFPETTFCGSTPLDNRYHSRWVTFFAEQRMYPLLRHLVDTQKLNNQSSNQFERLIRQLPSRLTEPKAPALIHGDLWSGNVIPDAQGYPVLIDPAAYYGHPEAELGMTTLFGGFSDRFYEAYQEVAPLEPNWQDRVAIYRLWHIANHAALFGGAYQERTQAALRSLS